MKVKAYAKINLALDVVSKRADGYPFQADRTCGRTDFVCSEGAFPPAGSSRVETL